MYLFVVIYDDTHKDMFVPSFFGSFVIHLSNHIFSHRLITAVISTISNHSQQWRLHATNNTLGNDSDLGPYCPELS